MAPQAEVTLVADEIGDGVVEVHTTFTTSDPIDSAADLANAARPVAFNASLP